MEAGGKRYIVYGSRSNTISIWNLADLHMGSAACAEDLLRKDVAAIRDDPCAFWFGGGDYADFIGYTDIRFDPDVVAPWISVKDLKQLGRVSMRRVRDLLLPIKDKCLGLLEGNHEKKYELKKDHEGLHGWLCEELGAANLAYSCLVDVTFVRHPRTARPTLTLDNPDRQNSRRAFRFFLHHGAGYAQTAGGKLNRLIQFMYSFDADVYMCGHVHDQVGRREPMIGADADCKKLIAKEKVGVISGSYLKTYAQGTTTYGEMKGYRPTVLGAAKVEVTPMATKQPVKGAI